jgi:hypothetical protein
MEDIGVIGTAYTQKRVLLTEDKDFGQLVYASHQKTIGVFFFAFPLILGSRYRKTSSTS